MADGDDVLTDDQEESFLTGTESIDGVSFGLASGIDAGRVGRAIAGSIVFVVALGANTIISGLTEAYTGIVDGVRGFLAGGTEFVNNPNAVGGFEQEFDGLIDVIFGSGIAAIRGAWSFSLTQFGPLAYPIGIGVVVGSFWVMGRGIDRIREVS
ncbi:hypothetical protein [Halorubrum aethiopicum]|uniref:hypothetical protein n=1 Tax=Halorubrum aethiopicum TaxID=1758255 RepID=UPI00082CCB39|nr:hypothetical protein [Halorubrum aethiopicum]